MSSSPWSPLFRFFFFNDTATTEIYTLSLHDALPIYMYDPDRSQNVLYLGDISTWGALVGALQDRKSTRLNSSHMSISYAVFCLKKKTNEGSSQNSQFSQLILNDPRNPTETTNLLRVL